MQILISLNSPCSGILKLPSSNLHLFQSLLYNLLPCEYADFLHNYGYIVDGHPMKLFAMSWPLSPRRPKFNNGSIEFILPVKLIISTPVYEIFDGIASGALMNEKLRVGNNILVCENIEAKETTVETEKIIINTLSPITCYTQMQRQDGRKYTVYFSPSEKDFAKSIYNNLVRKYRALYPGAPVPDKPVNICPLGNPKERIAKFSGNNSFPIKGWYGKFTLTGPKELLQTAVDCGLGAKNSSGWGCVEIVSSNSA